jgi:hypothetical protein
MLNCPSLFVGVAGLALLAGPSNARAQDAGPLAAASWMAGCWAFTEGGRHVEEQWMRPSGGVMLGMSRAVRDGKAGSIEFVLLRVRDGRLVYDARPEGQAGAVFPLVRSSADELVFEDLAHDFPQRIIYRRVGNDEMRARIEGTTASGPRGFDYPFKRVGCP